KAAIARRNLVLSRMRDEKYISTLRPRTLIAAPLRFHPDRTAAHYPDAYSVAYLTNRIFDRQAWFKSLGAPRAARRHRVLNGRSRITLRLDNGTYWSPRNYEGNNFGSSLTLLRATALSVNVVYAQVVLKVGPKAVVEVAHRLGITSPLDAVASIALGTEEVSPLEMAAA